jgi:hypothetical protein
MEVAKIWTHLPGVSAPDPNHAKEKKKRKSAGFDGYEKINV